MTDIVIVDNINKKLFDLGRSLDGRPMFRIVWSTGQLEKRVGDFEDYCGNIIVRQVYKALREVNKYSYCLDRWILEKLVFLDPSHQTVRNELVTRKAYDYEPIFVFQKADNSPLPVTWVSVEWIIHSLTNMRTQSIRTESMFDSEDKAEEEREIAELAQILEEDGRSDLFAFEESVFLDSTKQPYKEKINDSSRVRL